MPEILKVEKLSHVYSPGTAFERTAIKDIDLTIAEGEFVGRIGHTGSGKSTLVQHLNGLLAPSSGHVYVDGEDIYETKEATRRARFKVGLVFQYPEYQLFEETVYRDIAFGPKNMGLDEAEIDRRVRLAADQVGLRPPPSNFRAARSAAPPWPGYSPCSPACWSSTSRWQVSIRSGARRYLPV